MDFQSLDSTRLTPFHRKVTLLSAAGMFLDGYDVTVIAVALPVLTKQWNITSQLMSGALASSAIVGMLVGALVFGRLTDRLGRKKMYLVNLIGFVLFAVLTAASQDAWQLLFFRFILGIALGADYAVSPSLLAEYAPTRRRGSLLCRLGATWFLGSASTYVFALVLLPLGANAWRYMLLLGAVFALITLWMRRSIPESPRWLTDQGRGEEAGSVLTELGDGSPVTVTAADSRHMHQVPWRTLLSARMFRLTVFCCGFWFVYTLAYYGITFYTPTIVKQLTSNTAEAYAGSLTVGLIGIAGALAGVALVDRVGRRPLLIAGFSGLTVALAVLALMPSPAIGVLIALLSVAVLFANSGPGILNLIYPSEIFPTSVRATGAGLAAAFSRLGGIISTLFFPQLVAAWGIGNALWLFVAAGVVGLAISLALAPETRHRSLEELSDALIAEPDAAPPNAASPVEPISA